jgi:hypothetical protein
VFLKVSGRYYYFTEAPEYAPKIEEFARKLAEKLKLSVFPELKYALIKPMESAYFPYEHTIVLPSSEKLYKTEELEKFLKHIVTHEMGHAAFYKKYPKLGRFLHGMRIVRAPRVPVFLEEVAASLKGIRAAKQLGYKFSLSDILKHIMSNLTYLIMS